MAFSAVGVGVGLCTIGVASMAQTDQVPDIASQTGFPVVTGVLTAGEGGVAWSVVVLQFGVV